MIPLWRATAEVRAPDSAVAAAIGRLAAKGFPFPHSKSHRITQADFPAIIEQIRRENSAAFGGGHDQPVE